MIDVLIRAPNFDVASVALERMYELWGEADIRPVLVLQSINADMPKAFCVVEYPFREYNYSRALNLGFSQCIFDYTLVCSSHSLVNFSKNRLDRMLHLMDEHPDCVAVSLSCDVEKSVGEGDCGYEYIDRSSFDGFNGLNNSCSLIRRSAWLTNNFDETLPAAEDQLWTFRVIRGGSYVLHACWAGYQYSNARPLAYKKARDSVIISRLIRKDMRSCPYLGGEVVRMLKNIVALNFFKAKERFYFIVLITFDRIKKLQFNADY